MILHCPATDCAARSLETLCLSVTSGPGPGELAGFCGSMPYLHSSEEVGRQQHEWRFDLFCHITDSRPFGFNLIPAMNFSFSTFIFRCQESMQRIEQCPLGSVWLCSVNNSCKRTYLSQRDLQAHINHRHNKPQASVLAPALVLSSVGGLGPPPPITVPPPPLIQPPLNLLVPPASGPVQPAPTVETAQRPNTNLITIQIQDDDKQAFPPPPPPGRPANQPQLYPPDPHVYQGVN